VPTGTADPNTVLVVEDEEHLADLYADCLSGSYEVRTAYGGGEAIEMLSPDVDVALIDRWMPVVSGNEVLAEIEERGLPCRVAMVTAVDPDFDIIDMGCDDYLVKPIARADLLDVVDRLMAVIEYDDRVQELTGKKLKRNVLQVEKNQSELAESEEFDRLREEIAALENEVEGLAGELGTGDASRDLSG
jgi:DNA-binding response OmpR family regulator